MRNKACVNRDDARQRERDQTDYEYCQMNIYLFADYRYKYTHIQIYVYKHFFLFLSLFQKNTYFDIDISRVVACVVLPLQMSGMQMKWNICHAVMCVDDTLCWTPFELRDRLTRGSCGGDDCKRDFGDDHSMLFVVFTSIVVRVVIIITVIVTVVAIAVVVVAIF